MDCKIDIFIREKYTYAFDPDLKSPYNYYQNEAQIIAGCQVFFIKDVNHVLICAFVLY